MNIFCLMLSGLLALPSCNVQGGAKLPTEDDNSNVRVYEYAPSVIPSTLYDVKVNEQWSFVLPTDEHHLTVFSCDGPVKVEVNPLAENISSARVLPLSSEYDCKIVDGKVVFHMEPGERAVVEINGSEENNLFVFANPLDEPVPSSDQDIIRVKEGTVVDLGTVSLKDGQTLLVEGGAVCKGAVKTVDASNVSVEGYGILDSRGVEARGITFDKCSNVRIDGVTLLNNVNWSTFISQSSDVEISNYKVVATATEKNNGNENDVLDILGCTDVSVKGCFGYCHDDVFCIKSHKWSYQGEVRNVVFDDCIAWNYLSGNSFVIGAELNQNVSNVTYRNCVSIHSAGATDPYPFFRGGVSIHNCAAGLVSDILFENIVLEDCKEYGIYIDIRKSSYDIGTGVEYAPGTIDGVTLRNVAFLKNAKLGNMFSGYDDSEHKIRNLVLDNINIGDIKIDETNFISYFKSYRTDYIIK